MAFCNRAKIINNNNAAENIHEVQHHAKIGFEIKIKITCLTKM